MLRAEAAWLAAWLAHLDCDQISPLLNVGSSTAQFRSRRQPWIDRLVFAPLLARGAIVKHLDMKLDDGVDLTGDLMDPVFVRTLSSYQFRSILCSNVLEHVADRSALCVR